MTPRHLLKLPISAENQERAKFQGPEPAAVVGELRVTCKSFLKDGSLQCDLLEHKMLADFSTITFSQEHRL